jgi:hypothetical protein
MRGYVLIVVFGVLGTLLATAVVAVTNPGDVAAMLIGGFGGIGGACSGILLDERYG